MDRRRGFKSSRRPPKMNDFSTIQALAAKVSSSFETATRADGAPYVLLKDGHPQWMQDLCFAAHEDGAMLPDDWRYTFIREAVDHLAEAATEDEAREAMEEADIYTSTLLKWLASHGARLDYCDQARDELGAEAFSNTEALISMGQSMERMEVFQAVLGFLSTMDPEDAVEPDSEGETGEPALI